MSEQGKKSDISRRDLLKGACVFVAGGSITSLAGCSNSIETETTTNVIATTKEVTKTIEIPSIVEVEKPAIALSKGHIIVNTSICGGCHTCAIICSLKNEGKINWQLSRIQVSRDELGGCIQVPLPCNQCDGPECLLACPTGALHVDEKTGARVIDSEVCVGCQLCLNSCIASPPRIRFNAEKNICFKCDLCNGDPQCVKFCPTGAIKYVEEA
jgi:Fe-S-cluster-containing dehydrogenase component